MNINDAVALLEDVEFQSIEKDNMEFDATFSTYQVDALKFLLRQFNNFLYEEA